jgi:UDP-2,3-diacylglucosamine hydrolase
MGLVPRLFFLSDLHILPGEVLTPHLEYFFTDITKPQDKVYLLGDIFDYWIGFRHLELKEYDHIIELFKDISKSGIELLFIQGNRDYLFCDKLAKIAGIKLVGRGITISLGNKRAYITHGDFIYNKRFSYPLYRGFMELYPVRKVFTSLPPQVSRDIALSFKSTTNKTKPRFNETEENIVKPTIPILLKGYDILICGHLHIAKEMEVNVGKRVCKLYIIDSKSYLKWDGSILQLIKLEDISLPHTV